MKDWQGRGALGRGYEVDPSRARPAEIRQSLGAFNDMRTPVAFCPDRAVFPPWAMICARSYHPHASKGEFHRRQEIRGHAVLA